MVDKTKQVNKHRAIHIKEVANGWIVESWYGGVEYICTSDEEVVRRVEQLLIETEVR